MPGDDNDGNYGDNRRSGSSQVTRPPSAKRWSPFPKQGPAPYNPYGLGIAPSGVGNGPLQSGGQQQFQGGFGSQNAAQQQFQRQNPQQYTSGQQGFAGYNSPSGGQQFTNNTPRGNLEDQQRAMAQAITGETEAMADIQAETVVRRGMQGRKEPTQKAIAKQIAIAKQMIREGGRSTESSQDTIAINMQKCKERFEELATYVRESAGNSAAFAETLKQDIEFQELLHASGSEVMQTEGEANIAGTAIPANSIMLGFEMHDEKQYGGGQKGFLKSSVITMAICNL
jgi:cytochrome c biogenesis protein ResB